MAVNTAFVLYAPEVLHVKSKRHGGGWNLYGIGTGRPLTPHVRVFRFSNGVLTPLTGRGWRNP